MIFVEHGSIEASAPDEPDLFDAAVAAVCAARHASPVGSKVEIAFVADDEIRALNARHRGLDRATDVLSYPAESGGSIVIGIGILREQARRRGVSVADEAAFLALHGALHLLGHDDEEPHARAGMMRETARLAVELGLPEVGAWESVYEATR